MKREDFYLHVNFKPGGCWLWKGANTLRKGIEAGYGRAYMDGRMMLAHRVAYELEHGPIPNGLDIDHLCRTTLCVNPLHLEACSRKENYRRGLHTNKKSHCKRNHKLIKKNLDKKGQCRLCVNQRQREKQARLIKAPCQVKIIIPKPSPPFIEKPSPFIEKIKALDITDDLVIFCNKHYVG